MKFVSWVISYFCKNCILSEKGSRILEMVSFMSFSEKWLCKSSGAGTVTVMLHFAASSISKTCLHRVCLPSPKASSSVWRKSNVAYFLSDIFSSFIWQLSPLSHQWLIIAHVPCFAPYVAIFPCFHSAALMHPNILPYFLWLQSLLFLN